jgi:hypothetical protein
MIMVKPADTPMGIDRQRFQSLAIPFLVMAIDVVWAWSLATFGRPLLLQLLARPALEASRFYDDAMEPRFWISYAIVLTTQLTWVTLIAPRPLPQRQLKQMWWLGCGIILVCSIGLHQGLALPGLAARLLLLVVPIGDLLLLYWLPTRLLTPLPQRRVIPGG